MDKILNKLQSIETDSRNDISSVDSLSRLEEVRIKYLGRKSELTTILRSISDLSKEEKAQIGQKSNELKQKLEKVINDKESELSDKEINRKVLTEWADFTVPQGEKIKTGKLHPITQMLQKTEDIFLRMGFEIYYPFEVDTQFNNFTAVNIPEEHPARDMWDTFWVEGGNVAITHTSSMQHRVLKNNTPPIRAIVPGKTFRNEATDARHEHTFYQVEGIYVDKGITMADMLGTLKAFFSEFFGKEVNVLFTPDFFPFVEPGGMMSIDCRGLGEGFEKVSKGTGWLEVLGCGMIHPNVLELAGIDSAVYSGFAWGFGLERLIMLKYGIDDVRLFHSGNLKFIKNF